MSDHQFTKPLTTRDQQFRPQETSSSNPKRPAVQTISEHKRLQVQTTRRLKLTSSNPHITFDLNEAALGSKRVIPLPASRGSRGQLLVLKSQLGQTPAGARWDKNLRHLWAAKKGVMRGLTWLVKRCALWEMSSCTRRCKAEVKRPARMAQVSGSGNML